MFRRPAPPPPYLPGWGPMSTPTHPRPGRGDLRRELIVPGLLTAFLLYKGILFTIGGIGAFAIAMWLWFTWKSSRQQGRLLAEWAAVVVLSVILSNAGVHAPDIRVADRKAPTERVTEAKGYLDQARQGIENIKADIATRYADRFPSEPTKKGHR